MAAGQISSLGGLSSVELRGRSPSLQYVDECFCPRAIPCANPSWSCPLRSLRKLSHYPELKSGALSRQGSFQKRIRIGRRRIGWRASEVYGWIAKCAVNQASARSKHQLDASRGR